MRPNCRGHRVPCSRHALGISAGACGLSSSAVHRRLAPATSSSRELCASCRVLRPATCSPCLKKVLRPSRSTGERLPWGSVPHRGIDRRRPHTPGNPSPDFVPSSAFLTPSTVCSATGLRGFVSPRSHVQGLPYRGLSLTAEPYRVSPAESCPLAVGRHSL